jgi:hypothetical protein
MSEVSRRNDEVRLSTAERDEAVARIQTAYADGRLEEQELDRRLREALNAVFPRDLEPLLKDLPREPPRVPSSPPKSSIVAYGSRIERAGRWAVPPRLTPTIVKGHLVLDFRAAQLLGDETIVQVRGYKSTIEIIVPPGVEVESRGFAYKGQWTGGESGSGGAPCRRTIRIRGFAYKSKVIVRRSGPSGLAGPAPGA